MSDGKDRVAGIEYGIALAILIGIWFIAYLLVKSGFFEGLAEKISGRGITPHLQVMNEITYKEFLLSTPIFVGIPAWIYPSGIMCLEPGAFEDYFRLIANENPLLSMVLADKDHPYSRRERQVSFFVVQTFGFFFTCCTSALRNTTSAVLINCLVVSPFMILLNYFFYLILALPCCVQCSVKHIFSFLGHGIAFFFVIIGLVMVWAGTYILTHEGDYSLTGGANVMWMYFTQVLLASTAQDLFLRSTPYWEAHNGCCFGCVGLFTLLDYLTCFQIFMMGKWRRMREEGSKTSSHVELGTATAYNKQPPPLPPSAYGGSRVVDPSTALYGAAITTQSSSVSNTSSHGVPPSAPPAATAPASPSHNPYATAPAGNPYSAAPNPYVAVATAGAGGSNPYPAAGRLHDPSAANYGAPLNTSGHGTRQAVASGAIDNGSSHGAQGTLVVTGKVVAPPAPSAPPAPPANPYAAIITGHQQVPAAADPHTANYGSAVQTGHKNNSGAPKPPPGMFGIAAVHHT